MNAVMVAWFLLAWVVILSAARTMIVDLRDGHGGRSWCPDCSEGLPGCDCLLTVEVSR